jgi:tetratricopeptide (TPR) repeat protein/predicted Ser/Thr protein kinase
MIPEKLSHYRIVQQVGAGGMGVVYRAHDEHLDRDVALKVLPHSTGTDERTRQRFRKEALALAKLSHPNIGAIYEFGNDAGVDFLVMEFISGVTLDAKLSGGALPEKDVLRLGMQLANGLEAAHSQGIVHRDLKPGNIRLTPDGWMKILDFGIAQFVASTGDSAETVTLTAHDSIMGTVAYMAPEQIRGQRADVRSDIYSTGVVLYEMATGKRPFADRSGPQLISAILETPPSPPTSRNHTVSPALESIIVKALDKEPDRRYQSARELRVDLERLSSGVVPVQPPRVRSKARFVIAAAVLLLMIGAGFLLTRFQLLRKAPVAQINSSASPQRRSVAVLGFRNLSGNPESAWLSTALSEMLTTELAAGEQLRTIPGENVTRMRNDLSLPEADSYARDTLKQIYDRLGSDLVVLGSYVQAGDGIRLDFRMQDALAGETLLTFSENGKSSELLDLVSRTGTDLRAKLALASITPGDVAGVLATLPSTTDATRLYALGLEKLRVFDSQSARELLQKAVEADPNYALAHAALSRAWSALGYDAHATEEARKAFDLSANLPRESRLSIEARYRETVRQWPRVIEIYRALWNFFPDNLEYGLQLAKAQVSAGLPNDASETIERMRTLPASQREDPRIDLTEALVANTKGDFQHGQQVAGVAAAKARTRHSQLVLADALHQQGWAAERLGKLDTAEALFKQCQEIYESAGDRRGAATAITLQGHSLYDRGDFPGALSAYRRTLDVFRSIGAEGDVARALNSIGNVLYDNGKLEEAKEQYEQSLKIYQQLGDKAGIAGGLGNLANVYDSMGNLVAARKKQEETLAAFREVGDRRGETSTLNNLGNVQAEMGDLSAAKTSFEQAIAVSQQTGYFRSRAFALSGLADLLREQDKAVEARKVAEESLEQRKGMSDENNMAISQLQIAQIACDARNMSEAESLARKASDTFERVKSPQGIAQAQVVLARVLVEGGKPAEAAVAIQKAISLTQQATDRSLRLFTSIIEARIRTSGGEFSLAEPALQNALSEAHRYGYVAIEYEARLALGSLEAKSGKLAAGRSRLRALQAEAQARGYARIARKAKEAGNAGLNQVNSRQPFHPTKKRAGIGAPLPIA